MSEPSNVPEKESPVAVEPEVPEPVRPIGGVAKRLAAVRKTPPFRMWDLLVYGLLLAAIVGLLLGVLLPQKGISDEAVLEVYADGVRIGEYPVNVDGEYPIEQGGVTLLVLVVSDRVVSVKDSVCDDHLCERMTIARTKQQIVCLPNKITIALSEEPFSNDPILPGGNG